MITFLLYRMQLRNSQMKEMHRDVRGRGSAELCDPTSPLPSQHSDVLTRPEVPEPCCLGFYWGVSLKRHE